MAENEGGRKEARTKGRRQADRKERSRKVVREGGGKQGREDKQKGGARRRKGEEDVKVFSHSLVAVHGTVI